MSDRNDGPNTRPTEYCTLLELLSRRYGLQADHMNEIILQVGENDQPIGMLTKLDAHIRISVDSKTPLHRAFSIFVFRENDGQYELLLQKRSDQKITFPLCWTNTCCSHPSYESMLSAGDCIEDVVAAVKREAVLRLAYELNINQIKESDIALLGRVHYSAMSHGSYGGIFGENEIDYVFSAIVQDLQPLSPNPNEVCETRWVTFEQVNDMVNDETVVKSPWFEEISKKRLHEWWPPLGNHKINYSIIELDA